MAQCVQCGQILPDGARFCSGCGRPVVQSSLPQPASGNARMKWLGLVLGVLALALLAFVVGTQAGWFTQARIKKPEAPSVLEAEAPKVEGPSVLQAQPPKVEGPSMLETQAPKPQQPPQHILDWLEHLKRIEMRRQAMERNFNPALQMLKIAMGARLAMEEEEQQKALQSLKEGYQTYRQDWAGLLRDFQSVPPPPECRVLADTYFVALSNYVNLMTQIEQAMETQDLNTLMNMRGTAQAQVDQKLIESDVELARVCQQYGIRKDFRIGTSVPETLFGF
ncbi:MAG: zinc-ribbon domain-containing protein [Fimbriimonadales bacterium]|jgi:hypothetical protein|nr:zinc-ribbon domain [Armatimonadetes bacterium GXS]